MEKKPEKTDKKKDELAELLSGKREHTSLNLLVSNLDVLSVVAREKGLNKTETVDQALKIACGEFKNTSKIDNAIAQTNDYWFERDISKFKGVIGDAKELIAYQIAHLYVNLKDAEDRRRVFEALKLSDSLDELDAMKEVLEPARKLKDDEVIGFNIPKLANCLSIALNDLQEYYLQLILGIDAVGKIKKLAPEKFPKSNLFAEKDDAVEALFPQDDSENS